MKFTLCKKLRYFRIYKKHPKHLESRWNKDPGRGGYISFYQETSLMYIHDLVNTIVGEIRHTSREYWSRNRWLGLTSKRLFLHAHLLVRTSQNSEDQEAACLHRRYCLSTLLYDAASHYKKALGDSWTVIPAWCFSEVLARDLICALKTSFRHVPFFLSMMI